jgi:hypothetical protein
MNCCVECFRDAHIRATIENRGETGDCDFCAAKGAAVFDLGAAPNPVAEMIIGLVQTYSVSDSEGAKPLKIALRDDWDIFSAGSESILTLVKKLCESAYADDDDIFTKHVFIPQLADRDFLREYGVVRGYSWSEFSNSIKYGNRFHSGMFNAGVFASFLSIVAKMYPAGSRLYRARISANRDGFSKDAMGAPPRDKRSAGRINPEGIGVLYLSSDVKTVLNEVRASVFDYVTVGTFQNTRGIRVVNLSGVAQTSPFLYEGELEQFAANRKVFQEIAAEIAKPLRRSDSPLEYLSTQYITEFIKSEHYDGVEYASTLKQGGNNVAVFDETLFDCTDIQTVEVAKILYETNPPLADGSPAADGAGT